MAQFLSENMISIIAMIALITFVIIIQFFSTSSYVKKVNKKKIAKGMPVMDDDEMQLIIETFHGTSINTAVTILAAYIFYLLVSHFI